MASKSSLIILLLALSIAASAIAADYYDAPHKVVDEIKKAPEVPEVPYVAPKEDKAPEVPYVAPKAPEVPYKEEKAPEVPYKAPEVAYKAPKEEKAPEVPYKAPEVAYKAPKEEKAPEVPYKAPEVAYKAPKEEKAPEVPYKAPEVAYKAPKEEKAPEVPYKAPEVAYKAPVYGHGYYTVDTTVVQGYVYCQGCKGYWTKHIVGGEVAVECKNKAGAVVKGSDTTDADGIYHVKLPYVTDAKTCKVKLVKSADHTCDVITNVGKGMEGAGVTYLKTFKNEVFYKTAPFAFAPVCHPHY